MRYYFSRSTLSFYPEDLWCEYEVNGSLPKDVVEVSADAFNTFSGTPPLGHVRGSNEDGSPTWVSFPPLTDAELLKEIEIERGIKLGLVNNFIDRMQWPSKLALGRISEEERKSFNIALDYMDDLTSFIVVDIYNVEWPQVPDELTGMWNN